MAAIPYFLNPFAVVGTSTVIPNEGGSTGPVNYQYGFTSNYELDLNSDPDSLPIPRPEFNQLMLDITTAIQRLQLQGAPQWVAPATGSPPVGGPASYPLFARVSHNPGAPYGYQIWESQVGDETGGNTSEPGANSDWAVVSGGRVVKTGDIIETATPNGYQGALLCNGTAYNRADYPQLYNAITNVQSGITAIGSSSVTVTDSSFLSIGTLANVEGTGIPAGAYITSIPNATTVILSAAASASGTVDLRFFFFGINGATQFRVPNHSRKAVVGSGGSRTTVLGDRLGEYCLEETYTMKTSDLVPHQHYMFNAITLLSSNTGGPDFPASNFNPPNPALRRNTGIAPSDTSNPPYVGSQTAMNIVSASIVMFKYIKY